MRITALSAILPFAAITALVAVTQTLVIPQRGLDISPVGVLALGLVCAQSSSIGLGILVAIAAVTISEFSRH